MRGFLQIVKPNVPAPPLWSAPRENGVQLFSVRGFRHQIQQMLLHISQQLVSFIKKCLIKIANIHAHAITSVPLLAMWVRLPAGLPQAVVIHLPAHSGFQRFHANGLFRLFV